MPLVKASVLARAAAPADVVDVAANRDAVVAALRSPAPEERRAAVRACRVYPDAVALIGTCLAEEEDPRVLEVLVLNLVAIGGPAAAEWLAPLLRSNHAARRVAAAEALKDLGADALPLFDVLIRDADPQVRMLAAEIARGQASSAAAQTLECLLATEPEVNVCCAFVDVLAEIGSVATAEALRALRSRMPGDRFLDFSVEAALAQLPRD